jgi:hypothetical protein
MLTEDNGLDAIDTEPLPRMLDREYPNTASEDWLFYCLRQLDLSAISARQGTVH